MTTKREQELLEANHRLTARARAAEEKLAQAIPEIHDQAHASRLASEIVDHINSLSLGQQAAPENNTHLVEIDRLLIALTQRFERVINIPRNADEARMLVQVGSMYGKSITTSGVEDDETMISIPKDEYEREIREAFKAGWFTNAATTIPDECAASLDEVEVTDFEAYQDLGLTIYLDQHRLIKEEFGTQESPQTWADKWARKVDALVQQPADTGTVVKVGELDQPESIDPINEPRTVIDIEDAILWRDGEMVRKAESPHRVRHVKRGTTYEVLGDGEAQISIPHVVSNFAGDVIDSARILKEGMKLRVYRDEADGKLWLRFPDEFDDGRFETIR